MVCRTMIALIGLGFLVAASAHGDEKKNTQVAKELVGTYEVTEVENNKSTKATAKIEHVEGSVVLITYYYGNDTKPYYIGLAKVIKGDQLRSTYYTVGKDEGRDSGIYELKSGCPFWDKGGYKETWKKK